MIFIRKFKKNMDRVEKVMHYDDISRNVAFKSIRKEYDKLFEEYLSIDENGYIKESQYKDFIKSLLTFYRSSTTNFDDKELIVQTLNQIQTGDYLNRLQDGRLSDGTHFTYPILSNIHTLDELDKFEKFHQTRQQTSRKRTYEKYLGINLDLGRGKTKRRKRRKRRKEPKKNKLETK